MNNKTNTIFQTTMLSFVRVLVLLQFVWLQISGTSNIIKSSNPDEHPNVSFGSNRRASKLMMPQIISLVAKCGRQDMTIQLVFDRPFKGIIFSKGHFYDKACHYVTEENSGKSNYIFNVAIDRCGTSSQLEDVTPDRDMFLENTVVFQNDPLIQEVWDQARLLRCVWKHTFEKSVEANPFKVMEPKKVHVGLDDVAVKALMQIQRGKTPYYASPVVGYIHIGEQTTLVIYVQEPSGKLDVNVVSCNAVSARGDSIQLVDEVGCVVRQDLISPFTKTREVTGVIADLMIYSNFKAFRIGESPEFTISCQLEVCQRKCQAPCSYDKEVEPSSRQRRQTHEDTSSHVITTYHKDDQRVLGATNLPSAVVELHRGVVVMDKDHFYRVPVHCGIHKTVVVSVAGLLCVAILLSLLSCWLGNKVRTLQKNALIGKQ